MLSGAYILSRSGERGVQKRHADFWCGKWQLGPRSPFEQRAWSWPCHLKALAHAIGLEQQSTLFAEIA